MGWRFKLCSLVVALSILVNTTLTLYSQQVAKEWSGVFVYSLLFVINTIALISGIFLSKYEKLKVPNWFLNTVALASASYATMGITIGIFDSFRVAFPILIVITAIVYASGIWYGLKSKSGFYLSVIPISLIVIISALHIKISTGGNDAFIGQLVHHSQCYFDR